MSRSAYVEPTQKDLKNRTRLISAINTMVEGVEINDDIPEGQFGRVCLINSGRVRIDSSALDVEFVVPFDDDTEANEAEIIVYNLTDTTIKNLKYNNPISITAGYKSDTGVIFSGYVSKVITNKTNIDKVTTIYAIDDNNLKEEKLVELAFAAGTKASYILKTLISRLKLPLAAFKMRRDWTYKDAVNVDGGLMENIKKYSEVCGVSTYINKGKVYSRHISEGDNANFTISVETGMIGSPEEFSEEVTAEDYTEVITGYRVKTILQHRITTAAIVNLRSINVNGRFRVRKGEHLFDGNEFVTEMEVI